LHLRKKGEHDNPCVVHIIYIRAKNLLCQYTQPPCMHVYIPPSRHIVQIKDERSISSIGLNTPRTTKTLACSVRRSAGIWKARPHHMHLFEAAETTRRDATRSRPRVRVAWPVAARSISGPSTLGYGSIDELHMLAIADTDRVASVTAGLSWSPQLAGTACMLCLAEWNRTCSIRIPVMDVCISFIMYLCAASCSIWAPDVDTATTDDPSTSLQTYNNLTWKVYQHSCRSRLYHRPALRPGSIAKGLRDDIYRYVGSSRLLNIRSKYWSIIRDLVGPHQRAHLHHTPDCLVRPLPMHQVNLSHVRHSNSPSNN
jgi:hypothetical protein